MPYLFLNLFIFLQCNAPTFVGNGLVCGLDTDSDGFPDVDLSCDEPSCERVIKIHTHACMHTQTHKHTQACMHTNGYN